MSRFVFTVSCERIGRRKAYYVKFPYNIQLVERIKELPEGTRKWNPSVMAWELTTQSLYTIIRRYKGSNKINFDFDNGDSRKVFIEQIRKIDEAEKEKRDFITELNIKKEEWVRYKQELETTYVKYSDKLHALLKEGIKLYPHQIVAAMFMNVTRSTLISHEMGLGKAQDLDSKILTPNGWVEMRDIRIDDFVIGSDGKPKRVLGVYPQGFKDIYEIEFSDGVTARSCDDHLWNVKTNNSICRKTTFQTKTLREIIDSGLKYKNGCDKWYIPMVKPIKFKERDLKINPYVLGCLLSDGKNNNINKELSKYNQNEPNLYTKSIPNEYKFSSISQRFKLLQGILDNDGCYKKDFTFELILASKQLIEDVQFIVQSLGGIGRLKEKWVTYCGIRKLYWRLNIKLPPKFTSFNLKRNIKTFVTPTKHQPNRAIVDIRYVGKKEAQCIKVDSQDSLYVTDHCILTHNTLSSILYVEMNNFDKVFVITPNSLKFNYLNEVQKFTNSTAHIIGWRKNTCGIEDAKYIIVNYEFFNTGRGKDTSIDKFKIKWKKLGIDSIDAVICDESHRLKTTKSNTYKNFKRTFTKKIFKNEKVSKMFLSGTPAPNRAYELYSVLNQISEVDFPTKKYFYSYYCGMSYNFKDGWGYEVDEMETKFEELYHKIAPFTHRKRKSEVLNDLPDKTYQKVILEMSDKEASLYEEVEVGAVNEFIDKASNNPLTIMIRLRQYTSHLKSKYIKELITNVLETGEKVIVVDVFKESLKDLNEMFGDIAVLHTGDVKSLEERNEMVKQFQDPNSNIKIFLASTQTANYGLTLTAASKMFIITPPYSVGEYDQVADRCHRIGQKNAVNIYPLIFPDTIDEYVYSVIESKRKEIIKVMDNEDYTSNVNESVLSEVIEILKQKHGK